MKSIINKLLYLLFFFSICYQSSAQKKEPYDMMVNGVKVIVQPGNNEIIEIQAIFKGGVQNYPADKAGIEALAIKALSECGTAKDDKNSFKNKLDKVNAYVYGFADMDFSIFGINCIKSDLNKVWSLYVEALTTPKFDAKEFNRIKDETLNNIREQSSQPDFAIDKMAKEAAFAGKDYAKNPTGIDATVKALTVDDVKNYYKDFATRSRMFIVVVGDIDKSDLEKRISKMLSGIPQGQPFVYKHDTFIPKANSFKQQKKDLATNYIEAITSGPEPGSKDYNAFVLAMRIFYDHHFLEIRTNNGLSYAPYSFFDGGLSPYAGIGVSTTDPNKYIQTLNKLITKTKKGFTEDEVKDMKTTYITSVYYQQETNSAQAYALASNEAVHNNWRRAITLNDDLKDITAKDVTNAFNKYVTHYSWVYQGNPAKVNPKLYTEGQAKQKLPPSKFINKKEGKTIK